MSAIHRQRFELTATGRRLRAERLLPEDTSQGPALVFLHEGLGSIGQWKAFPTNLCQAVGLPGLVYERWGFGGSEPLDQPRHGDYLHDEARDSLPEVLERCGIDRPILIGHSDGGSIALLFAAAYPNKVTALITEAAHVFVEELTLAGIRAAVQLYETTDLPARLTHYHGANTDTMFRAWSDTWLSPGFRNWNIESELASIICPALILQGKDDEYGTPDQVTAIVNGIGESARGMLVPGCAHIPHHQAQKRVLEEMAAFIRAC